MTELGLTVESCIPKTIEVTVEKLVKKRLQVQCLNDNGVVVPYEIIEPAANVEMFVRSGWTDEMLKARVVAADSICPTRPIKTINTVKPSTSSNTCTPLGPPK